MYTKIFAIGLAILSTPLVEGLALPAPAAQTGTSPVAPFTVAYNFCQDLKAVYGIPTIQAPFSIISKRDGDDDSGFDLLDSREIEERAIGTTTLPPALPGGRTYKIVSGSRGHKENNDAPFHPVGETGGPCILFSYGQGYLNLELGGNPTRVLFPMSVINNSFETGVKICQTICDRLLRVQSVWDGKSAQCNAITPWISQPPADDPFKPLGQFIVCELFPGPLTTKDIGSGKNAVVRDGLLANAVVSTLPI